jgi:hypothetical protein
VSRPGVVPEGQVAVLTGSGRSSEVGHDLWWRIGALARHRGLKRGECLRSRTRAVVIASRRRRRGNLLPAKAEIASLALAMTAAGVPMSGLLDTPEKGLVLTPGRFSLEFSRWYP